ncbi:MAG: TetR/AcrR family transcriptional regulator [Marinobacterium sp.]|nr:TetR/AcrR family transcriptional regulator [Marinobacterium sp.]
MSPKLLDEDTLRAREAVILDAAQQLLNQIGATALTMDKVVSKVPYSKGTVYNHFSSKEDLLITLCNESMQKLVNMFERALKIDACSRDRMLAVGFAYMLYATLYPDKFMLVITAKTPSVSDKASTERQQAHLALENRLLTLVAAAIATGVEHGELTLPPGSDMEQVSFAFWSSAFGAISLLSSKVERCSARSSLLLEQTIVLNANLLFDGLNWQPTTDPQRTASIIRLLKEEVFSNEMRQLAEQGYTLQI